MAPNILFGLTHFFACFTLVKQKRLFFFPFYIHYPPEDSKMNSVETLL